LMLILQYYHDYIDYTLTLAIYIRVSYQSYHGNNCKP
jgi:hypothetical protein